MTSAATQGARAKSARPASQPMPYKAGEYSPWKDARKEHARSCVVAALRTGNESEVKRGDAMHECGQRPAAVAIGANGTKVFRKTCKGVLCPCCAEMKARRFKARFAPAIESTVERGRRISLLTLTVKHRAGQSLSDLIEVLQDAWRRFYRHKFFKAHITNWFRAMEFTHGRNGWHPHWHVLIEAGFIERQALIAEWQKCVRAAGGDAEIVDIREVRVREAQLMKVRENAEALANAGDDHAAAVRAGVREVIGYCVKVDDLSKLPAALLLELAQAIHGRRLRHASKGWRELAEELEQDNEEPEEGDELYLWDDVVAAACNAHSPLHSRIPSICAALREERMHTACRILEHHFGLAAGQRAWLARPITDRLLHGDDRPAA